MKKKSEEEVKVLETYPIEEETSVAPLELTGGLNVTREELNLVVAKLNELIRKN